MDVRERRLRARHAAQAVDRGIGLDGLNRAIQIATEVIVTSRAAAAMLHEVDRVGVRNNGIERDLEAALRELGFEVIA